MTSGQRPHRGIQIIREGDHVRLDGSPGTYRARRIVGSSVEVEHLATGNPAGIWPLDVTVPVEIRTTDQSAERNCNV